MTWEPKATMMFLLLAVAGCGSRGNSTGQAAANNEEPVATAKNGPVHANESAGTPLGPSRGNFTIGGTTYSFRVVRCDLSGEEFDGMLLAGGGTTPDGRRLAVEVERVDGERIVERASVMIGQARDGERWGARRAQGPDGSWFGDEAGQVRAGGPLVRITGSDLVVEAGFDNRAGTSTEPGVLRASCARIPG